jgi:hypothetical protein
MESVCEARQFGCAFFCPFQGGRSSMARKRNEPVINSVMFTYVGTDKDFNQFLKTVVHDYLMLDNMTDLNPASHVEKVEKDVA